MESDTLYGDFMVIIWRLYGNMVYHVFPMKTPDNFQANLL